MPCDTVTVQAVGGLEQARPELMREALSAVGVVLDGLASSVLVGRRLGARVEWAPGVGLTVSARSDEQAQAVRAAVLQSYSRVAVSWAAKRAGWRVGVWSGNNVQVSK
jgi:hypothetical protein